MEKDEDTNSTTHRNSLSRTASFDNLYEDGTLDPVYYAKTLVLNQAIQEIGMGRYQVCLALYAFFYVTDMATSTSICFLSFQALGGLRKCTREQSRTPPVLPELTFLNHSDSVWPVSHRFSHVT